VDDASGAAAAAAIRVARESYGRIVAWLAWQWRDIAAAEDALAEAFATALARWPAEGVPVSPEGWLVTAAKRHLLMAARRRRLAEDPAFTALLPAQDDAAEAAPAVPDVRLRLMLVCAHPALDPGVHSALMLQVVLGLPAARIAQAWLIGTDALAKRLTRAKAKIRDARIRFEEPEAADLGQRVDAVLEAVYGAYTLDWNQAREDAASDLADEAVYLAELVASQLPEHAEAHGLLALLWLNEARARARRSADGAFVPLDRQDPATWDAALIARADERLAHAAGRGMPGPYQLEAAIQAAHASRLSTGVTPWADIARLYERLLATTPTIGARIGHAVAHARACDDAAAGVALLDGIDRDRVATHQPWWAARAYLLARAGRRDDALIAYDRALALTVPAALRAYSDAERARVAAGRAAPGN
jgi:RNA polymerase sigma-70 factor (ECF subfamily)